MHRWRMEHGVELVHLEPTEAEFRRILGNWMAMPGPMKVASDRASVAFFGMTNLEHARELSRHYAGVGGGTR